MSQTQLKAIDPDALELYRQQLKCSFAQLDDVFADCMEEAVALLSAGAIKDYLDGATLVCMIGRGFEPVLVYLEEMPGIASRLGEDMLSNIAQCVWKMSRSPNGASILPFLQSLPEASRRLGSAEQMQHYLDLVFDFMEKTTGSIHGFHTTIPSPGLPDFLDQVPYLLNQLSIEGLRNWVEYGIRNYRDNPERQRDFFSLQSADSRAMLQRERHGTLFADNERKLDLYLRGLWEDAEHLVPYSQAFDELRKPMPYYDAYGIRVPDVYDDQAGIPGIDRYRALLAHIAAHRRWTTAIIADNYSPFQRIAIELFEDSRVEYLVMQRYPGLRRIFQALHPVPREDACDPDTESCIRHRLAMLSRLLLDPEYPCRNADIHEFAERFFEIMRAGESSTAEIAQLAISFIARTRRQGDLLPNVHFDDTVVDYRDDNRHMWKFIEEGDEEEAFDEKRKLEPEEKESQGLPPRHYPEWDYQTRTYRPDWVSVYEVLHPQGKAADIDRLLQKHSALAKRLKRMLEMLKPQQYVRIRYQEDGSELDLDVAIRSLIDFRCGAEPDPRINMSHRHDGRDLAVTLLLDLSESINQVPAGCEQSILELSQEAVSLLAWSIEQLGDPFAIAGFHSNTRHDVRFLHFKGFREHWGDEVKGRLAAMDAAYSTRMGAAMRHAAHYLGAQKADKKLMLILTDGEPSDVDASDERLLIEDAHRAVQELDQDGIYTYCISLDPRADAYVGDIFGKQYTVIDRVDRLPEKLPQLFMALTR
ncbi:MAG TPA: VWA domain-containing protein [Gammaproteobacteria bacterium]|nr:VWA domain-containing protein [Gammaproteobacteria bacterium]